MGRRLTIPPTPPRMVKIALSMIVKPTDQEAVELERCLKSIRPHVDGFFLTLSGPKDQWKNKKIEKVAMKYKAAVSYFEWVKDFAAARNFALSQIPKSYDFFFWCDADDIIHGAENLHSIAEWALANNFNSVFCNYVYQAVIDETKPCACGLHGSVKDILIQHLRERLVRNDDSHKWVGEIHETCIEQRPTNKTDNRTFEVIHLTTIEDMQRAIQRNIEILEEKAKREEEKDPRTLFYLGKAYFDLHTKDNYHKAAILIRRYLDMSGWTEERAQAWEYMAAIHQIYGQHDYALKALFAALDEDFKFPSIYASIAYNYMLQGKFSHALHWVRVAATQPMPKTTVVTSPLDIRMRLLEVTFVSALRLKKIDEAYSAAQKLYEMTPDHPVAIERMQGMNELKTNNAVANAVAKLANYLMQKGDQRKLLSLIQTIPDAIANEPAMMDLRNQVMPPRTWGEKEIAIYCGPGFEQWSPLSVHRGGLGGSETAVIYLSKELTKLGWKVTVYADPREEQGEYEGVTYLPFYHWNARDIFNILIAWRQPGLVDTGVCAKNIYVDMHDVGNPAEFTPERLAKIDRVVVKSEAHYQTIKNVPREKILVSTNGIDTQLIEKLEVANDPLSVFWGSSYDRGLSHLLDIWPEVIKEVPQAKLHVFYGWNLFDAVFGPNGSGPNPERQAWKAKMEGKMNQPGVIHHGRVAQRELLEWVGKCGIWAYPTDFYEINCITALQCQALGAIPVVINYAALKETVQFGEKVDGDIYDPDIKKLYQERLINLLKNPDEQGKIRSEMMNWARSNYSWEFVARQWHELFNEDNVKEAIHVILKHEPKLSEFMPLQYGSN